MPRVRIGVLAGFAGVAVLGPATARATYSIVATDSATEQVGGAVTSCVGSQGVGVVYRPAVGHGGVNAQAAANATGRDRAVMLLNMDVAPADIIAAITAPSFDSNAAVRQYGVVDLMGRAAGFTGSGAMNYKEDRQGTIDALTYSVQGNILTSRAVIDQAETAFRHSGCDLADRLMLALEAGAVGGEGDSRCTPRGIPSDAASIEVDVTGETAGSYLKLAVAGTGNTSAVVRLRTMFDSWRSTHGCPGGAGGRGGTGAGAAPPEHKARRAREAWPGRRAPRERKAGREYKASQAPGEATARPGLTLAARVTSASPATTRPERCGSCSLCSGFGYHRPVACVRTGPGWQARRCCSRPAEGAAT